jgi:hypothetical protein
VQQDIFKKTMTFSAILNWVLSSSSDPRKEDTDEDALVKVAQALSMESFASEERKQQELEWAQARFLQDQIRTRMWNSCSNAMGFLMMYQILTLSTERVTNHQFILTKKFPNDPNPDAPAIRSAVLGDGLCSIWAFIVSYVGQFGHWGDVIVDSPLLHAIHLHGVLNGQSVPDTMEGIAELLVMVLSAMTHNMVDGVLSIRVGQGHVQFFQEYANKTIDVMQKIVRGEDFEDIEGDDHLRVLSILLGVDLQIMDLNSDQVLDCIMGDHERAVHMVLAAGHYEACVPSQTEPVPEFHKAPVVEAMRNRACSRFTAGETNHELWSNYSVGMLVPE